MHLYMYMHWYSNSMLSSACSFRSYSQAAKQLTWTNIPQLPILGGPRPLRVMAPALSER